MLKELFGHTHEQCHKMAETVDTQGKVIVFTTTKEHAELKRDQILAYGKDDLIKQLHGSMHSTIESVVVIKLCNRFGSRRPSPNKHEIRINAALLPTPLPNMKLRTVTLGCKVNQYETEYVREGLLGIGYEDASDDEAAELCIVNTCTVTNEGDSKSRQTIRRLARRNPGAKIVVMGCYATRAPEEVAALPGVSQVVTDKRELPDLLGRFGVTDIPTGISGFGRRHRAYVKVQDGCMLRCSFCIIPHVRPHLASRPMRAHSRRSPPAGGSRVSRSRAHRDSPGPLRRRLESPILPLPERAGFKPKSEWIRLSHLGAAASPSCRATFACGFPASKPPKSLAS